MVYNTPDWIPRGKFAQPGEVYAVILTNEVVVCRIVEYQRKKSLFFQVRLMDTGEASGDDGGTAEESWRHGSMLAAATFTVVMVTHCHPFHTTGLVMSGYSRYRLPPLSSQHIQSFARLVRMDVDCSHEHVVTESIQMATISQPGSSGGNVVCGAFSLDLYEDRKFQKIVAIPDKEGFQ